MDSSLKSDLKESSSTISKPGETDQKDSSVKPSSGSKFTISLQQSLPSGTSSGSVAGPATTSSSNSSTEPSKATSSSAFSSSSSANTTSSSGTPHSVTISLGVGALQVGKSQTNSSLSASSRVPSPPKSVTSTGSTQDATSSSTTSGTSSVSISPASVASALQIKEASKGHSLNSSLTTTPAATTSGSVSGTETPATKSVSSTSHSHLSIASSLLAPTSSSPAGGTNTSTTTSATSAMKRPPSEISGSMSSTTGSTNEPSEAETGGVEHKRKKMRKEPRTTTDSPATSSASGSGSGRSARNAGNKQNLNTPSGGVSGGDASQKTQGGTDNTLSTKEKPEDSSKHHHDTPGTGYTGNGSSSLPSNSSSTNGGSGGGPKVPPLKIVLQAHSHNVNNTTSSSNETPATAPFKVGAGGGGDDASSSSQASGFGQGPTSSGFPYVVSITSSAEGNPSSSETSQSGHSASGGSKDTSSGGGHDQKDNLKETGKEGQFKGVAPSSSAANSSTPMETSSSGTTPATSTVSTASSSTSSQLSFSNSGGSNQDKSKGNTVPTSESSAPSSAQPLDKSKLDEEKKESGASGSLGSGTRPSTPATATTGGTGVTADAEKEKDTPSTGKEKDPVAEKTISAHPDKKEKEKPVRVTRSSQRILKEGGTHTPNSPSSSSPKTSACPSPSHSHQTDSQGSMETPGTSKGAGANDAGDKGESTEQVELHPRKRKIKSKDIAKEAHPAAPPPSANAPSTSAATSSSNVPPAENVEQPAVGQQAQNDQPMLNCFEMYLNIRKQIDRRRRNLFPVTPKPPKGFKDYLMNRGTYVLAGNANALAVPLINPTQTLSQQMKDFFSEQEKDRHKLRLQHLVEKEKLVLSVEQEILRVHGRAARALSNQTLPFSVCTILKDQEVYNLLTPEQEEKDINARSRYNGRLFLSWLQDVDDKWDKIKEYMLLRHHNEAESLHAVQKMDWEWKLKEFGLCEPKATPQIDDLHVPMVHVSDDFDLLPA